MGNNFIEEKMKFINQMEYPLNVPDLQIYRSHRRKSNRINSFRLNMVNMGLMPIDLENVKKFLPRGPMDFISFQKHRRMLEKYRSLASYEFGVSTKGESHSMRHGLKSENGIKNCNKKLLPCPNEETIGDFWRMVWEQNSYIIVMLTKVFDFIRVMCCQYWPIETNKPVMYGPMEVTLLTEEPLADFTIRTLKLRRPGSRDYVSSRWCTPTSSYINLIKSTNNINVNQSSIKIEQLSEIKEEENFEELIVPEKNEDYLDGEERVVYQFHYYNWPTHSCPFVNSLLQYRRRIRIYMNEVSKENIVGPTIVHCSDGCGRTGAYLCIDANLEFCDEDNSFDIFGYTKKMRQARKGMIETMDQYKFVYSFLEEAYLSGKTWFPVSELAQQMKYKSMKDTLTGLNEYQREYQKIVKMSPEFTIGDCAGGYRIENRAKNRDVAIIPPDNHRPYLTTFQSNDSTDYINAVFVDGYTRSREYIVTEWPLAHTIPDCWSLIYDHDCNSVIVLSHPEDIHAYPTFWPNEKEKRRKFGPVFTVDLVSFNHYTNIKSWIFRINKKVVSLTELMSGVKGVPKTTQFFQITCWPQGHKVPSSTNALVEMMNMVERWRQRTTYGPVCVIAANGRSRVGVYCAANVAIEQVVQHGEVDVFQAVKTVRRNRPKLIENETEYKYCYDLILHYVLNYLNQSG